MLLQSTAMVATKWLVNDKVTACFKQLCLLGVVCQVLIRKHCLVKHFVP